MPKIYGITGGIGSGKSTVAQNFLAYGVPCLDADQVARRLREPGQAAALLIEKRFGSIDRVRLREIISQDPQAKKDLETILHPLIRTESDRELETLAKTYPHAPFLLYEATLLIEAGRKNDFEGLIIVTAPAHIRIERIIKRDLCTKEQAQNLISTQMSDQERLQYAHFIINNDGSAENLRLEVKRVMDEIRLPKK